MVRHQMYTALIWFTSFLNQHMYTVVIVDRKSDPVSLEYGVPQGTVLGPTLYSTGV